MADDRITPDPATQPKRPYVLIGLAVGVALGIAFEKLALGIIFGLAVGIILQNRPGTQR